MQQNLKLNPHGIVGGLLIILMFGIAFLLGWNISWWYFAIGVVLYSVTVISLTLAEEAMTTTQATGYSTTTSPNIAKKLLIFRWLLGCHLALAFFAVGLIFPEPTEWFFFNLGIVCGPAISFLLLRPSANKNRLHLHGLVALLLIILMAVVAFLYVGKHVGEVYAEVYFSCVLMATLAYVVATVVLKSGSFPELLLTLCAH
jgi:hypothetical protein